MAGERDVALVADYLIFFRGAERTFAQMAETWPDAPIHTIAHRAGGTEGRFTGREIHTSYLQRMGLNRRWYRRALPLLPHAAESLDVARHQTVVSSSFGFAHGVHPSPGAVHVCYCHSPFRQAWFERDRALAATPRWARRYAARTLDRFRDWDREASRRVTDYVANSRLTADRIADFYDRAATVIHPPVEVERFAPVAEPEDYFLFVGELVAHKRPEVALEAARLAGMPIALVGDGPERRRLQAAHPDARFLGRIGDAELARVYARCRALVLPNVEEFGIAAVEAQASGRPVMALAAGGAIETIRQGETGVLVDRDDPSSFAEAMRSVDFDGFDPAAARRNAERFSAQRFRSQLRAAVDRACSERSSRT